MKWFGRLPIFHYGKRRLYLQPPYCMKQPLYFFLLLGCIVTTSVSAQDTLPRFSLTNAGGNRIIIGWVNSMGPMRQISIQRSFDSTKAYKTILSVADPNAVQNGFVDTKAPNDHMWYRLFYVRGTGEYYFTAARRPKLDTVRVTTTVPVTTTTKPADSNVVKKPVLKDSTIIKNPSFVPSFYVYTNNAGDVYINLPDADKKKYNLKFFDEANNPIFDIKEIKETGLTLDKTNFYHAGWFWFELYNDETLVERHKFYVARAINFK